MIGKSSPPNSRRPAVGFRKIFMSQINYIIWEYKAIGTFKREGVNNFYIVEIISLGHRT